MNTIKDVANAAGVSIATVSNYINRTKPVSKQNERRIKEAIELLQYTPNLAAKSLKSNRYDDIGVILPHLEDQYYAQIFQGIESYFRGTHFFLNLAFSNDIPDLEKAIVENFLKKNICGLILVTCMPDDWRFYYDRFISRDKPLVLIDRFIDKLDTIFVSFDNRRIVRGFVKELIQSGKKQILLFTGPTNFYSENECIRGYRESFMEAEIDCSSDCIITGIVTKERAFQECINVFKTIRPDAIIATSELCAMGIVEALTLLGLKVGQIPVITLGEEHWNQYTHSFATFSTIRPTIQLGKTAAQLLSDQIQSPKTFEKCHIVLNDRLVDFTPVLQNQNRSAPIKKTTKELHVLMLETPQTEAIKGLLPSFENTSGIKLKIEVLPHEYLFDRITSNEVSRENQADIFMYDIPWLYDLAAHGHLADITPYIKDPSFDESVYLPGCLKYFSEFEGKYYGLPFMYGPQILYYRKDLFENLALASEYQSRYHSRLIPPRTWREFVAIAEFFTNNNITDNKVMYGTSIPTAYKECLVPEIYMRLWAFGGNVFDNNFRVTMNTPQSLKAYINYKSTFKYAKPDFRAATDISVVSDFLNGDVAMLITYPSFLSNVTDLQKISLIGEIGYNHIPGRTPILGGWSIGISAKSKKKNDSFEFLKWTATKNNANYFTLLGGQPAINSIFTNDELINLYPWLPLYRAVYNYAKPILPPYKKGKSIIPQDTIDSVIFQYATDLIEDRLDVSATIEKTHQKLAELLESSVGI